MRSLTNISKSASEFTRHYSGFSGVDLGSAESGGDSSRLAYCENMYRDYESGGEALESVPGYRRLCSLGKSVKALYIRRVGLKDEVIIHAEDGIYSLPLGGDGAAAPTLLAKLEGERMCGFSLGDSFYLVGGGKMLLIDGEGGCLAVGEAIDAYLPTAYFNGEPLEARNLLSDVFAEEYSISDPTKYAHSTPGLRFEITDRDLKYCTVVGCDEEVEGAVYIPSRISLDDGVYEVRSISPKAFYKNRRITEVHIAKGLQSIGIMAFYEASAITKIITPDTLLELGGGAFTGCRALKDLYIGSGTRRFGASPFTECFALTSVSYGGSLAEFRAIENYSSVGDSTEIICNVRHDEMCVELPLHESATEILSLTVGGEERQFSAIIRADGSMAAVFDVSGSWELVNKCARITARLAEYRSRFNGLSSTADGEGISGREAIFGCTVAEIFDGRVFLSGNPALPGAVFYSSRDREGNISPLYFGIYNYWCDGLGGSPVSSLLAVRDLLAVFKSEDDGAGSIFYHEPKDNDDPRLPRIYPVKYIHSGIGSSGRAISFLDDPVFVSAMGVTALSRVAIDYQRSVVCRSHNVNNELLTCKPSEIYLCPWQGYLAICSHGRIYLADSRATFTHPSGAAEYEWFMLRDIGTYKNARRVYRYASVGYLGYFVHKRAGDIAEGEVYSTLGQGGALYYYVKDESGLCFAVEATAEMTGGEFSPATVFVSHADRLLFATESGDICIFNNDMRGVAPAHLRERADFDAEEYRAVMGRRIHPCYYAFDDHAPRYAIVTARDDCSIPHLTKSTVKNSGVVKFKSLGPAEVGIDAITDKDGFSESLIFPGGPVCFEELDFSCISFDVQESFSLPVTEGAKNWISKQYTLSSKSFRAPFGVYSLTYRYRVKGNIK